MAKVGAKEGKAEKNLRAGAKRDRRQLIAAADSEPQRLESLYLHLVALAHGFFSPVRLAVVALEGRVSGCRTPVSACRPKAYPQEALTTPAPKHQRE